MGKISVTNSWWNMIGPTLISEIYRFSGKLLLANCNAVAAQRRERRGQTRVTLLHVGRSERRLQMGQELGIVVRRIALSTYSGCCPRPFIVDFIFLYIRINHLTHYRRHVYRTTRKRPSSKSDACIAPSSAHHQVSTGRGGAGNLIRSPSRGVDPDVKSGGERGRSARDQSLDRVGHRLDHRPVYRN